MLAHVSFFTKFNLSCLGIVWYPDRIFVAVLYTCDSDKVMRYTDEGPVSELCKWSVDLGMLPSFQQHAASLPPGVNGHGFYTEFELGLELDSAGELSCLVLKFESVPFNFGWAMSCLVSFSPAVPMWRASERACSSGGHGDEPA